MDRRTFLAGAAATAAAGPLTGSAAGPLTGSATAPAARAVPSFEVVPDGAWSWFGDPRAVHHRGDRVGTYVGYLTSAGDVRVSQFDHGAGRWTTGTVASGFQIDDHNHPSIVVRPDNRIVLFWSGHAGRTMFYRRSARAEDVSAWEPVKSVPTNTSGSSGYTYPNPVQLSAERDKLYLFWRGGNMNPTFSTTTGSDRWTPAQNLILVPGQRPYLKVASNGTDTIHFAFTDGHPRNVRTSIYYMFYRHGSLFRPGGERIGPLGTPVTPAQATKVYDATGNTFGKAWIHDIAIGADGRPVIVYATFPTDDDHRYRYARWDGRSWNDRQLTAAGGSISADGREENYSGGITLDSDNPNVLVLSREVDGMHEIERWTTPDGGQSWSRQAITGGSSQLNVRPVSPRGLRATEPLGILWMSGRYHGYTRFDTRVLTNGG